MKKNGFSRYLPAALAMLLLALPEALSARERRGVGLVVSLKDGSTVSGELIAVKPDSLLLLAGKDESVDLAGIRSITVLRRSKAGLGAVCGFLAGALVMGSIVYLSNEGGDSGAAELGGLVYGGLGGLVGGAIGFGIGASAGKDKIITLEGMSEEEAEKALDYLRGKARIRDNR